MHIGRYSSPETLALAASLVIGSWSSPARAATPPPLIKCDLTLAPAILDPRESAAGAIGGMNLFLGGFGLVDQKPAAIAKEPAYVGKPLYGALRAGNGPRSVTYLAIDEAPGFAGKVYVDLNQNGDLTDDGTADWDSVKVDDQGRNCMKTVAVRASWGGAIDEKESGSYSIWLTKRDGNRTGGGMVRTSGRIGVLNLAGKAYPIVLGENANDGIFTVPADADLTRPPVTLYVDTESAAPFDAVAPTTAPAERRSPQKFNLAHPVQIDGRWYLARPSISGATLTVQETTPPDAPVAAAPEVAPEKVPLGAAAPDFAVETPDGKPLKLSDLKGKLVILDFWATWCGPCQQSMPGLEKLYQRVKDQDVVVLSVSVLDEKAAFEAWIAKHADKDYHFTFGFDPAGKAETGLTSSAAYDVPAIPAWFLIGRDGKVVAKNVGYDGTENTLIRALRDQKVRVDRE